MAMFDETGKGRKRLSEPTPCDEGVEAEYGALCGELRQGVQSIPASD